MKSWRENCRKKIGENSKQFPVNSQAIMLKFARFDNKSTGNVFVNGINGAKYIPVNLGGTLVNSVNELGKDLLKASAEGDTNEISRLLASGAPFAADWLGTSPLHLAAKGNHLNACEILLRSGISSNARTKVDRTPLHMASYEGHVDIVELLLNHEAEIDSTDLLGMTPLHWAAQNGHDDVVRVLLRFGASKGMENKFRLTPYEIARQIERTDIMEMIEKEQSQDTSVATENLTLEMANDVENLTETVENSEEIIINQFDENVEINLHEENSMNSMEEDEEPGESNVLSDSMKILQEHGITMLPNDDDNNILSSVMENGHSVVLTDVGKQVLDSVKASEEASENITRNLGRKNFITVTSDEFLRLTTNGSINRIKPQVIRRVEGKLVPKTIKRIVMKKNKLQPITPAPNILKQKNAALYLDHCQNSLESNEIDVESIVQQLNDARKTIEEYKIKLMQKEAEAEQYKQQLNILLGNS